MNRPRWTLAHGFFLAMGGIVFYDKKGLPVGTLIPNILFKALETGKFAEWPFLTITKEEIEDKSKSDPFTKSILVIQTAWFTARCIGRIAVELPLVELEVITLAFTAMNVVTFAMRWHKPQNVNLPIPVTLTPPQVTIYLSLQTETVTGSSVYCMKQEFCRVATNVGLYFQLKLRTLRNNIDEEKMSSSIEQLFPAA